MMKESNNLETGRVLKMSKLVDYTPDSVLSRTIIKKDRGNITLFAFAAGQGLSRHSAPFDAFVYIIEGEGRIIIGESNNILKEGECIIMPANVPHSVEAEKDFKMLLVMVKD